LAAAALLVIGVSFIPGYEGGTALAQGKKKEDSKAPFSGKQSQTLSKRVYEIINEANLLVDAEDYAGARVLLDKIKAMPKLSSYETAQMYTFYGYLYFNAEQYSQAIDAYSKVLQQPDLPEGIVQNTYRTLAQLAFATEDYNKAISYANEYMTQVGPDPGMYVIIGTAYYQIASEKGNSATKADYGKIITPVEKAIDLSKQRAQERAAASGEPVTGGTGKEQWWLLLRVAYWEQENYPKVAEILEFMIVNWPKKEYWTQLSGIYFELNDESKQLGAYEAAYDQGLLDKSAELVQLAQLLIQAEAPYKGGRILEKGLEAGIVERKMRNLRLLSQAWQLAQEYRAAIAPLEEAAKLSDDGELYARLAQSHLNLSEYKACKTASNKAVEKGKLKNMGNAYLVLGMCQFESNQLSNAKASFRKALRHEKAAKNARSWIDYVTTEQARLEQLKRALRQAEEYLKSLKQA
jgi:tetratricopeptide (TPR) repeat protein